jgi:serine/threonine protein kinase
VNEALCKKVMADLLGACAQIHSAGVFHRDIKPENCIVAGGQLKLIDFGAGCDIASKTGLNDISIDPFYAPPEKRINPSAPAKACRRPRTPAGPPRQAPCRPRRSS